MSAELYAGTAYRAALARRDEVGCDPQAWADVEHQFGDMPLIIYIGDFLQLRPHQMGLADDEARVKDLWVNYLTFGKMGTRLLCQLVTVQSRCISLRICILTPVVITCG